MNALQRTAWLFVGISVCVGCAPKSLPPGTPPPEYETRSLEPWPPAGSDAGANDAAAPPSAAPAAPSDAAPDAGLGDAGVGAPANSP